MDIKVDLLSSMKAICHSTATLNDNAFAKLKLPTSPRAYHPHHHDAPHQTVPYIPCWTVKEKEERQAIREKKKN